jgi:hypothetical protein
MSQENVEIVKRALHAWNERDHDGFGDQGLDIREHVFETLIGCGSSPSHQASLRAWFRCFMSGPKSESSTPHSCSSVASAFKRWLRFVSTPNRNYADRYTSRRTRRTKTLSRTTASMSVRMKQSSAC